MTYISLVRPRPERPTYKRPTTPVNSTDAGPYPSRFPTLPVPLEKRWTPNGSFDVLEEEMRPGNRDEKCFDGVAGDSILNSRFDLIRKVDFTYEGSVWLAFDHQCAF
jgi:hypothetical protein